MTNSERAELKSPMRFNHLEMSISEVNHCLTKHLPINEKGVLLKAYKHKSRNCTRMLLLVNTTRVGDYSHIRLFNKLKDINNDAIERLVKKKVFLKEKIW